MRRSFPRDDAVRASRLSLPLDGAVKARNTLMCMDTGFRHIFWGSSAAVKPIEYSLGVLFFALNGSYPVFVVLIGPQEIDEKRFLRERLLKANFVGGWRLFVFAWALASHHFVRQQPSLNGSRSEQRERLGPSQFNVGRTLWR